MWPIFLLIATRSQVTLEPGVRTYADLAKEMSVEGKTVVCAENIQDRVAFVALSERSWAEQSSLLSRALGLKFTQDEKDPSVYVLEADPEVESKQKRLYSTWLSKTNTDIEQTLRYWTQYAQSGAPKSIQEVDTLMGKVAGPRKTDEQDANWVRLLKSDVPEPAKAALFVYFDTCAGGTNRSTMMLPILQYFSAGNKIQNLIPDGVTFDGTAAYWSNSNDLFGSIRTHVASEIEACRKRASLEPTKRAERLQAFDRAVPSMTFSLDIRFDPRRFAISGLYSSYSSVEAFMRKTDQMLALTDITAASTDRMATLYKECGLAETWEKWKRDTAQFIDTPEAKAVFKYHGTPSLPFDQLRDWAAKTNKDAIMAWDPVHTDHLTYGFEPGNGQSTKSTNLVTCLEFFKALPSDRATNPWRGQRSPGVWAVEQIDGVYVFKSAYGFMDDHYAVNMKPLINLQHEAVFDEKVGEWAVPLSAAVNLPKELDIKAAQSYATLGTHVIGLDVGNLYPFFKYLSSLDGIKLRSVENELKNRKEVEIGLGKSSASKELAKDIRTMVLATDQRSPFTYGGVQAPLADFTEFVQAGKLVIKKVLDGPYFEFSLEGDVAPPRTPFWNMESKPFLLHLD